jgi:hypothetical protein
MSRELRTTLVIMAVVLIICAPLIFAAPAAQTSSYLAMVFAYTPPTPEPIKAIENGDFEQGRDVGWTTTTPLLIVQNAGVAHTGAWSAQLGSSSKRLYGVGQNVTITAAAPYLVYWSRVSSDEFTCTYDYAYVRSILIGTIDQVNEFCQSQRHSAYRKRAIDLRRWAGYTIDITFYMSTDSSFLSTWSIDDVGMQAAP